MTAECLLPKFTRRRFLRRTAITGVDDSDEAEDEPDRESQGDTAQPDEGVEKVSDVTRSTALQTYPYFCRSGDREDHVDTHDEIAWRGGPRVPREKHRSSPHVGVPMPVDPPEVIEAIIEAIAASVQPDPTTVEGVRPGPEQSPGETDAILAADEHVPFVDPATERVLVTELLGRADTRDGSDATVAARRKEIQELN